MNERAERMQEKCVLCNSVIACTKGLAANRLPMKKKNVFHKESERLGSFIIIPSPVSIHSANAGVSREL